MISSRIRNKLIFFQRPDLRLYPPSVVYTHLEHWAVHLGSLVWSNDQPEATLAKKSIKGKQSIPELFQGFSVLVP